MEGVNELEEKKGDLFDPSTTSSNSGKSLSQRERVARASGPGEGYRIY